jgi:hypothetical protein
MKTKVSIFLFAGGLLAFAGWFVHVPAPAQGDKVPEQYRDTLSKGLEYLVTNQHKDGHWEGDEGKHPVAMTGLVGLALVMETAMERSERPTRVKPPEGKYAANIRKAVDWLISKSDAGRDGLIFSEHASERSRYMEGHGLATLFLAGAYKQEHDETRRNKIRDVLVRAVRYIGKAQSSQGGWYHTSRAEGHDLDLILATAIQLQALRAADNVGIPLPSQAVQLADEYLRAALRKQEAQPPQNRNQVTDTAAALACLITHSTSTRKGEGAPKVDDSCRKQLKVCEAEIPVGRAAKFGRDELAHYYYAQAVFDLGETWTAYRKAMFDHLQTSQHKDGSWPAADGISVGPLYATALWCTVLQFDKRNHPSIPPVEQVIITITRPGGRGIDAWTCRSGFPA